MEFVWKSDLQLDYKIAYKSAFEPMTDLLHLPLFFYADMSSIRFAKVRFVTIFLLHTQGSSLIVPEHGP